MPTPSTLFPVQETTEISENRHTFTMPTPELKTTLTLEQRADGTFQMNGGLPDEQTLNFLRAYTQQIEAQIKQKSLAETHTTTVSQATDDCESYPGRKTTSGIFPPVNTSVEVHSPDQVHKPWFGNISETQSDILATISKACGIPDDCSKITEDRTAKWAEEQQVALGVTTGPEEEAVNEFPQTNYDIQEQYAPQGKLPDIDVFNCSDSFELEEKEFDKLLNQDPYLSNVVNIKPELSNDSSCEKNQPIAHVVDLGDFHSDLSTEANTDVDDMGPYRNPPSVSSVVSNSTYMSDYSQLLSPKNELEEVFDQTSALPQKVHGRRSSKRRTSGGKDIKRLLSVAKSQKSSSGKPYPPASACSARRLSRFQHTEYQESNLQEGWWNMLKRVEQHYLNNIDFAASKVEDLRKYCHDLFAVVLFSPTGWGNNQKRKGIYRKCMQAEYDWDQNVPFRSLNNSAKKNNPANKEDAPRANKEDLVKIGVYLMKRYKEEVRAKIQLRNENNQWVRLHGVEESDVPPMFTSTPAPAPQIANTVHNHLALAATTVPKMEPIPATDMKPCDFPEPVINPLPTATAVPAETVTSSYIAMETEPSSTVDLELLMQCLGQNNHLVTTGDNQNLGNLGIEIRQPEQQMDTTDELSYKKPQMKVFQPTSDFVKVKLEHSYSIPDDEKEMEAPTSTFPFMTVSHDAQIPGAVLQLAETKPSTMIQTVKDESYLVAKMAENFPTEFSQVIEMIDQLN